MAQWEKILVAVDEGETTLRALRYTARMAAAMGDVSICLLHVYPEPPPDFYVNGGQLADYQAAKEKRAEMIFAQGERILFEAGIRPARVQRLVHLAAGRSISQVVLDVQKEGDFGTVAVGKRGVSKAEEFLFGSISNALARHSNRFTTWVVG
ncbi:MAG: universal stress protein [Desulfocapsaceae bacterium]|nr:universal stress protein [Desulfocapsaceae bacterium]